MLNCFRQPRWSGLICRALILVGLLVSLAGSAHAEARGKVLPGHYLVKRKGVNPSSARDIRFESLKLLTARRRPARYNRFRDQCRIIRRIDPTVTACVPDFLVQANSGDPFIFQCATTSDCNWGIDSASFDDVDAPLAWLSSEGDPGLVVAILDTGLDLGNPDIAPNLWVNPGELAGNQIDDEGNGFVDDVHGANMVGSGPPQDNNGHGTHVAGILAAIRDNDFGVAGVAPKIKILPVKILGASGGGSVSEAVKGVDYVVKLAKDYGVPIIAMNNSWGGIISDTAPPGQNSPVSPLKEAFMRADEAGIISVAAAGNGGVDNRGDNIDSLSYYPAKFQFPLSITVASIDTDGELSSFSNFGPNSVDLAAPGGTIRSLLADSISFGGTPLDGTTLSSGTSMATPFVTGTVALISSHFSALLPSEVRERLLNRTIPLREPWASRLEVGGRVNAYYALNDEEIPVPSPTSTPSVVPTIPPTPEPTAFTTPTLTPKPTPTVTAAPSPGPSNPISIFEITAAPSSRFTGTSAILTNFVSAKKNNMIRSTARNSLGDSFILSLEAGSCLLAEKRLPSTTAFTTLRFDGAARSLKSISLFIRKEIGGEAVFSKVFTVKDNAKVQPKPKCRALSKGTKIR